MRHVHFLSTLNLLTECGSVCPPGMGASLNMFISPAGVALFGPSLETQGPVSGSLVKMEPFDGENIGDASL